MRARAYSTLKVRAHVYIGGRVQGVFFRSETKKESLKHGVVGWVRNRKDGRVEAVFEGEKNKVMKLLEYCRRGTQFSKVVNVDVVWETYTGEFNRFQIRWRD